MESVDVKSLPPGGLFVTGTDTEIGKTHSTAALLRGLRAIGRRVQGMKPVASGCTLVGGVWRNEDAVALMAAAGSTAAYADINPYALPTPTAPQLAAAEAGMDITLPAIIAAYRRLSTDADTVLVEGVGGWLAPLSDTLDQSDLVRALDVPVVLVVGLRLGCINHARLTERAILADGCRLIGWLGNAVMADFDADGRYAAALARSMASPCLGWLPFRPK